MSIQRRASFSTEFPDDFPVICMPNITFRRTLSHGKSV